MNQTNVFFMTEAIKEAEAAAKKGEVPVGAVAVLEGKIISRGYNSVIKKSDPSAHAEIVVLRRAGKKIKNYRLAHLELYVTLEPCLMCFSAMVNARIKRLVYSAVDDKTGVFSCGIFEKAKPVFNHDLIVESGILSEQSSGILRNFFQERRDAGAVERGGLENR